MKKEFKKVILEDVIMVYKLYCHEENVPFNEEDYSKAKQIYEKLLNSGNYTFACYINDMIVGVVNVYKNMQYYPTDLNDPFVHLECVIIDKEYQNIGIGTEMMKKVVELVKEEGYTYIIGQSKEPRMQKVFRNAGLIDETYNDFRI